MPKSKIATVDYEEAVGEAPRRTLLYLGTRSLDLVDTPDVIVARSRSVSGYISLALPMLSPEHQGEFLSTAAHVFQALAVRLRKIEDYEQEQRLRRRGGGVG